LLLLLLAAFSASQRQLLNQQNPNICQHTCYAVFLFRVPLLLILLLPAMLSVLLRNSYE
jgi:hypothetical protein